MGTRAEALNKKFVGEKLEYKIPAKAKSLSETVTRYNNLRGKIKKICDEDGKIIVTMERLNNDQPWINPDTKQPMEDKVPIEHVLQNMSLQTQHGNNLSQPSKVPKNSFCEKRDDPLDNSPWKSDANLLKYGEAKYTFITLDEWKIDEEVVWPLSGEPRLNGKITWTGEQLLNERREVVAVIQFLCKQGTGTNHLPRPMRYFPANRNVVNIRDLLHLRIWLEKSRIESQNPPKTTKVENLEERNAIEAAGGNKSKLDIVEENASILSMTTIGTRGECSIPIEATSTAGKVSKESEEKSDVNENCTNNSISNGSFACTEIYPGQDEQECNADPHTMKVKLSKPFSLKLVSPEEYTRQVSVPGTQFGIQGNNNSCYMDASIFALFAFNKSLDSLLGSADGDEDETCQSVKTILIGIIKRLRQNFFVSKKRMNSLRKVFVQKVGICYGSSFMDAEEFIIELFNLINVVGFFTYNHGGQDYIHQIVLPKKWDESTRTNLLAVQTLLNDSFIESVVTLFKKPRFSFIIKLPVSDGKLIPCKAVIPNLRLDLSTIVVDETDNNKAPMYLQAVICLRNNHFVTFVCMDPRNFESNWVFMDSNPTTSSPEVHILSNISSNIKQAENDIEVGVLKEVEPGCGGFKLFRDAYICIYVQ